MSKVMTILALIITGCKFPFIGRGPEFDNIPPDTWPRVAEPGRWIHDMTNVAVETVRADCEFWTKCLSFVILCLIVLAVLS